jgi:hypothetical protein
MRKDLKHGQEEQISRASPASGVCERAEGSKAKIPKAMEDAFAVSLSDDERGKSTHRQVQCRAGE